MGVIEDFMIERIMNGLENSPWMGGTQRLYSLSQELSVLWWHMRLLAPPDQLAALREMWDEVQRQDDA